MPATDQTKLLRHANKKLLLPTITLACTCRCCEVCHLNKGRKESDTTGRKSRYRYLYMDMDFHRETNSVRILKL